MGKSQQLHGWKNWFLPGGASGDEEIPALVIPPEAPWVLASLSCWFFSLKKCQEDEVQIVHPPVPQALDEWLLAEKVVGQ